jgi:hypothetical protein
MAEVRGKFTVTKVTTYTASKEHPHTEITLSAMYSQTPEDNTYASSTPSGSIVMTITNEAAIDKLPIGGKFYVDFTACE